MEEYSTPPVQRKKGYAEIGAAIGGAAGIFIAWKYTSKKWWIFVLLFLIAGGIGSRIGNGINDLMDDF